MVDPETFSCPASYHFTASVGRRRENSCTRRNYVSTSWGIIFGRTTGISANSVYLHIYAADCQETAWDIATYYYNLSVEGYAKAADEIRGETDLYYVNGDEFRFYTMNKEYVTDEAYTAMLQRFINPEDPAYQMKLGTYQAPITIR